MLLAEVGRCEGDGLPEGASGAALLCFASGRTEKHAVDETVGVLRAAGMAPLEVESYGVPGEADGPELGPDQQALADRALAENAVVVASVETFEDD